jgi:hypothetical protein
MRRRTIQLCWRWVIIPVPTYITLQQGVPCILHLENRCGEKFIKIILLEGYDTLPADTLKNKYLKDVENVLVNSSVLDTPICCTNWRLVVRKDSGIRQCIKYQTLANTQIQKFLDKFDLIATLCIGNAARRADCNSSIYLFCTKTGAVEQFQTCADDWWAVWRCHLLDIDGITNCTHIISSGHLAFYMKEWWGTCTGIQSKDGRPTTP